MVMNKFDAFSATLDNSSNIFTTGTSGEIVSNNYEYLPTHSSSVIIHPHKFAKRDTSNNVSQINQDPSYNQADTIAPVIHEEPPAVNEVTDTISIDHEEIPASKQDTIAAPEPTGEEQITEEPEQPTPAVSPPKRIHPDSLFTVEADPQFFETTDSVFETTEPAVNYFGEHQLQPQNPIREREKPESADWALPLLILSIFCVAITKYRFYGRFKQILSASIVTRYFNQMEREGSLFNERLSFLLFANFLIVLSMLAYQTFDHLSVLESFYLSNPLKIVFITILVLTVFFTVKYFVLHFLGWVFKAVYAAIAYFKNILIFNMIIGIILLPLVFIQTFVPSDIILYTSWGILILANLLKLARGVLIGHNTTHFSGYYLILYLCGVEIVPLLLIFKFSFDYLNTITDLNQVMAVVLSIST